MKRWASINESLKEGRMQSIFESIMKITLLKHYEPSHHSSNYKYNLELKYSKCLNQILNIMK